MSGQETGLLNRLDKDIDKDKKEKPLSEAKRKNFTVPTVGEVQAYCQERGNQIDAAHFVDYYEANGWHVGKQNMKDWKAAVRTWERNQKSKPSGQRKETSGESAPNLADVERMQRMLEKYK